MAFAFRVGAPETRVRVTARGVRVCGEAVAVWRGPRLRLSGPSSAALERVRCSAQRAEHTADWAARLAELDELRRRSTSVHLQEFPAAQPPGVPPPPLLQPERAVAEAEAFYCRVMGSLGRSGPMVARRRAHRDAPVYLAAEQARLARVYERLTEQAAVEWQALLAGDERTVCAVVNAALADADPDTAHNAAPAADGCVVGLRSGVLSVVVRQRDLRAFPHQAPAVSAAGRPTLATLTTRDRIRWWLEVMGSQVIATVRAALATAPTVSAVDLAVLTGISDACRLGVVAYGRWTRQAVAATDWHDPDDALRFLDVGEDVACGVSGLPPTVRAVDTRRLPELRALVDTAVVDGLDGHADPARRSAPDPYALVPFARWIGGPDARLSTR